MSEYTPNFETLEEGARKEQEEQDAIFSNYLNSFKQEAARGGAVLHTAFEGVAEQIRADREAEAEEEIAKAQEEAAAAVSAKYRKQYGAEDWNETDTDKGYKKLLENLI